jgi:hypothetical protein
MAVCLFSVKKNRRGDRRDLFKQRHAAPRPEKAGKTEAWLFSHAHGQKPLATGKRVK